MGKFCKPKLVSLFLYWFIGEMLQGGIQDSYILSEDEAIVLRAQEEFTDTLNVKGNFVIVTFSSLSGK